MQSIARLRRRITRGPLLRILGLIGAGLLVLGWLTVAPSALGGPSTYITTYGNSMEPILHRGDLAVVREQSSYRVGDVVAYRSALLKTIVLHRIVDREGDRYVFKGDNNSWIDTDRPTESDLVGRMTMRLPGVGTQVQRAASPPAIAAMASVAFIPLARGRRRRRRAGETVATTSSSVPPPRRTSRLAHVEPRLLIATAAGVGLLAVAFTRPATVAGTSDVPYDEKGAFSYVGAAPSGSAAYQSLQVSSGQPVFLSLVERLDLAFTYRVSATAPVEASGDIKLTATIKDSTGWAYPVDLAVPARFDGQDALVGGTLDLKALRSTINNAQFATGIVRDRYTVTVDAAVTREVRHKEAIDVGDFAASLSFNLDDTAMYLDAPGPDALAPAQGGLLSIATTVENDLRVLGRSLPVPALRLAAAAVALIIAALWLDWLRRARRDAETDLIERRYRHYLLPVSSDVPSLQPAIDVESMADLARLADHAAAPILRGANGSYDVVDGARLYRYTVAESTAADRPVEMADA